MEQRDPADGNSSEDRGGRGGIINTPISLQDQWQRTGAEME